MIVRKLVYMFFSFIFVLSFFGFIGTAAAATTPQTTTPAISANAFTYTPMEQIPGQSAAPKNFYEYVSYLYKFGIAAVGIAALLMITIGGFMYITSAGNNARMESAKGVITDAIAGLVLALSAYLILYTINPELVRIQPLSVAPTTGAPAAPASTGGMIPVRGTSLGGRPVTAICSGATSNYSTCFGYACSVSRCPNLTPYESAIQANAAANNLDPKEIKAIICAESGGIDYQVSNSTPPSCGLMQVQSNNTNASLTPNQRCVQDSRGNLLNDTNLNIRLGTQILRQKKNAVAGLDYSGVGITKDQLSYANYNCCSNGDIPSARSVDCGPTVPKWACNLNPGTGSSQTGNMCAVRTYVCSKVDLCKSLY